MKKGGDDSSGRLRVKRPEPAIGCNNLDEEAER